MSHGYAAEVSAIVFAVDGEVERCFDLMGQGGGCGVFVCGYDCPVVDFCGGHGPLGCLEMDLLQVSTAKPGLDGVDEEEAAHLALDSNTGNLYRVFLRACRF